VTTSLSYVIDDGIATISIDDGKANVMGIPMLSAINAALDRAEADQAAVVIQGRPGMFSGGFDLAVFKRDPQELYEMLKSGAELTERVLSFPHPVIAVCTGHAIAMGAFLLLSSDLRIGTMPEARIQVNEVQIGFNLPYFAIEVCRQRLSPAHFSLATLTAAPYSQTQAVEAGFLDELTSPDDLPGVLQARKAQVRSLEPSAFKATKLRLRETTLSLLRQAIVKDLADWSRGAQEGS